MLAQRVASAVVGIPLLLTVIWFDDWTYVLVAAAVLTVGTAEFQHLKSPWTSVFTIGAALYAAVLAISARTVGDISVFFLGAAIMVSALPSAYAWLVRGSEFAESIVWFVTGVVYVGVLGSSIVLLRDFQHGTAITVTILNDGSSIVTTSDLDNGRDWVYLALLSTFAADTAAYFTGRTFGRHKLAPSISPKKTWEGFAGGWVAGFAVALGLKYVFDLPVGVGTAILLAVTLPIAATAGDLFESWMKRLTGVKDASELIPGHGGVLDRLDSLLFTFPLVYAIARWAS